MKLDAGRGLVKSIVTPRFAITCSPKLMTKLGEVARDMDLNIQSHLSENKGEVTFTRSLFPTAKDYTSVYDQVGLLGPRTIMAHSIYLSDEEQDLLKARQTSISHCPNSNFALSSGVMPLRKYLNKGLKVGLGTDVSGGYSLSILDAMRQAVIASKVIAFQNPDEKELSIKEAFYLATLGGAEALALNSVGNFAAGKKFDALIVNYTGRGLMQAFERFLFCGQPSDIKAVYVDGRETAQRTWISRKIIDATCQVCKDLKCNSIDTGLCIYVDVALPANTQDY